MIKLYKKQLNLRYFLKNYLNKHFLLKIGVKNKLTISLITYNLLIIINKIFKKISKIKIINKCCITINSKRFNNITMYSRFVFKKKTLNGKIYGIFKC